MWSWDEAQRCEASGNGARFHWRFTAGVVKECVLATNFSTLGRRGHWKGDIWEPVRDGLGRLGVAVQGSRGLLSEFHLTDNRSGYLHVSRYDFDAPGLAGADGEAPIDLRLEARIQWAQEYAALAASGLARSIEADGLQPGGRAPAGMLRLSRWTSRRPARTAGALLNRQVLKAAARRASHRWATTRRRPGNLCTSRCRPIRPR